MVDCSEETLKDLVAKNILKPFYIIFVNHSHKSEYYKIYAKCEMDARLRAFSIWYRNWDEITDKKGWENKKEFYLKMGGFARYYEKKGEFVLDWN